MATRRDQLQSYQFLTQRVISAFVMRETDPAQSPLRRGIGAVFAGLMIGVLVAAGFGVYGLLTKIGSGDWKVDGAVVVEKESGAAYVYNQGTLYPAINYTSALLAAGGNKTAPPQIFKTSAASLRGVHRGPTIGIVYAPNSLPSGKNTIGAPWSLCSIIIPPVRQTVLIVGGGPSGDTTKLTTGTTGQGLMVSGPGGTFLVWNGRKYHIKDANSVLSTLYPTASVASVGAAWLNGLQLGQEIATPTAPDTGNPSPKVPGHNAGDLVYRDTPDGRQYYLVYDDGLATLTDLQRQLVAATENPQPIKSTEVTAAGRSSQLPAPGLDQAPPPSPPHLQQPTASTDPLCIQQSSNVVGSPDVLVGGTVTDAQRGTPTVAQSAEGGALADWVYVPAGKVAVIQALASPTAPSGPLYLVTDTGQRYLVPSLDVLKVLGFQQNQVVQMPFNLVSRIPAGPTLDPGAAAKPVNIPAGN
ncbi:MAG: type VII secretion protein EccB [Micromonosporaceae bacterium]|nr:type VII secretion protein EccB [Micromonosporaceae bacterium]